MTSATEIVRYEAKDLSHENLVGEGIIRIASRVLVLFSTKFLACAHGLTRGVEVPARLLAFPYLSVETCPYRMAINLTY